MPSPISPLETALEVAKSIYAEGEIARGATLIGVIDLLTEAINELAKNGPHTNNPKLIELRNRLAIKNYEIEHADGFLRQEIIDKIEPLTGFLPAAVGVLTDITDTQPPNERFMKRFGFQMGGRRSRRSRRSRRQTKQRNSRRSRT